MHRAYSLIKVKSIEDDRRIFRGIATSPAPDRVNDRIDPFGAKFADEIPLLSGHDHRSVIGTARLGKPTKNGIPFVAEIPVIHEPPTLKERVDVAWGELAHRLIRAVSIGFRPTADPVFNKMGGYDFPETEIMELSTVVVPCQPEAIAMLDYAKSLGEQSYIRQLAIFDDAARIAAVDGKIDPEADPEFPPAPEAAALGKSLPVVRLDEPVRARTKPFVIRNIITN